MKKILLITLFFVSVLNSNADTTVKIDTVRVDEMLKNKNVTHLCLIGDIDRDKLRQIQYLNNLVYLDLSKVKLVGWNRNGVEIDDDIFPSYAFYELRSWQDDNGSRHQYENSNKTIKKIILPESVKSIDAYAFKKCVVDTVVFPACLRSIGSNAFECCEYLRSVNLPDSLKVIESGAFIFCSNLDNITFPKGIKKIGNVAFIGCKRLSSLSIPDDIEKIDDCAFAGCTDLTSVNIPKNVKEMGGNGIDHEGGVFKQCTGLTSVTIPKGLKVDLFRTFAECTGLKSVILPDDKTMTLLATFQNCTGLDSVYIPAGIKLIRTFEYCRNLKKVIFSPDVNEIGSSAFEGCSSLSSINIPMGTKIIENYTFRGTGLKKVEIPQSVIYVGSSAFGSCPLESISVPNSVKNIAETQLMPYEELINIFVDDENSAFSKRDGILYSKDRTKFLYCSKDIHGSYTIPDGITEIGSGVFSRCQGLKAVKIPNGVISINSNAFEACSNLRDVELPNSLEKIGYAAFDMCDSLKQIRLPSNLKYIGDDAFEYCSSLLSIDIPKKVREIGARAFAFCENLGGAIVIPGSVETIQESAFEFTNLKKVTLKEGVKYIKRNAFSRCDSIESLKMPNSLRKVEEGNFSSTKYFKSITIPKNTIYLSNLNGFTKINLYQTDPKYGKVEPYGYGYSDKLKIVVPLCSYFKYKKHSDWDDNKIVPRIFSFNVVNWFVKEIKNIPSEKK